MLPWVKMFKIILKKYDVGSNIGIDVFKCGEALMEFNRFCDKEQKEHDENWRKENERIKTRKKL